MNFNKFKLIFYAFVSIVLISNTVNAQTSNAKQHIEVTLRMVGHQFLLSLGDTTSRILPILKEDDKYIVQFETEFEFDPEELVLTIDEVFENAGFNGGYNLEVEDCTTKGIVYSYEITDNDSSDIIPCKARSLPKSCYNFLVTINKNQDAIADLTAVNTILSGSKKSENGNMYYYVVAFILLFLVGILIYLKNGKTNTIKDSNLIALGKYQFNQLNSELMFEGKKMELTSKEADLLILLFNAVNTTVERDVILNKVWGDEGDYIGRTLDVFISKLRKKLEADSAIKLVNIRGVGYKLVMDV